MHKCARLKPRNECSSSDSLDSSVVSSSNASIVQPDQDAGGSLNPPLDFGPAFNDVYSLENVIGNGSYARVYRCVNRVTSENFAVKIIEDKLLSNYQKQLIYNEEGILRKLKHRNIIKLVAVFVNEPDVKRMVFEFADQLDVCLALVTDPNFSELSIKSVTHQLFGGLQYLHSEGIVHRDLKLENLLVKSDASVNVLKICDFGYAVKLPDGESSFKLKNTIIGSFEYMSPELIGNQEYSTKIDCWAAGVIVYFLFTGDFPFKGNTVTDMVRCIMKRQFTLDLASPEWAAASRNAVDFIRCILEPVYSRPNAEQLLRHAWFTNPPNHPGNMPTDLPLPIMRQRERLEFLQHEAEVKLRRLYNNSSSNNPSVQPAMSCWSTGISMRRYRNRYLVGSHEESPAREFLVNGASIDRRRWKSCSANLQQIQGSSPIWKLRLAWRRLNVDTITGTE